VKDWKVRKAHAWHGKTLVCVAARLS